MRVIKLRVLQKLTAALLLFSSLIVGAITKSNRLTISNTTRFVVKVISLFVAIDRYYDYVHFMMDRLRDRSK